ncbi:hypothetical protein NP233_g7593 [Leucocoprinus birnbaumii]|uniref:Uncharacterized protein n=1 Tax=Leucocoprinus birnbaumii TaxID=56174 RepID=A0AAD5VP15_9AGAR|nr:hypothetical protein NP233_g7593 [Leucocoprinus birnbaumii]
MPNPANPFGPMGQQPASGQRPLTTFLTTPDQNFLQAQPTGANPFRQSMLMPQTTGMALFGVSGGPGMNMGLQNTPQQPNPNPFPGSNQMLQPTPTGFGQSLFNTTPSQPQQQPMQQPFQQSFPASASAAPSKSTFSTMAQPQTNIEIPQRPASTPLTTFGQSASPPPLKPQMTGTRNPFGPVITPAPPVPKPPTMAELAAFGRGPNSAPPGPIQQQPQQPAQSNGGISTSTGGFNFANSALNPGGTDMGSVASSFAFADSKPAVASPTGASSATSSGFSGSTFGGSSISGLSSQPTSTSSAIAATSSLPTGVGNGTSAGSGALKPQMTGFAGLKAFKPTSSFGAALMESLPPVPNSTNTTSPNSSTLGASTIGPGTGIGLGSSAFGTSEFGSLNKQQTGFGGTFGGLGALNAANGSGTASPLGSASGATSPTGASKLGVGLRPQLTGGGAANPFRASMAAGNSFGAPGGAGVPSVPPLPTGFGSGSMFGSTPFSSTNAFGNSFVQTQQGGQQPGQQQQQQQQGSSLI